MLNSPIMYLNRNQPNMSGSNQIRVRFQLRKTWFELWLIRGEEEKCAGVYCLPPHFDKMQLPQVSQCCRAATYCIYAAFFDSYLYTVLLAKICK
jgi:hypothetical protein